MATTLTPFCPISLSLLPPSPAKKRQAQHSTVLPVFFLAHTYPPSPTTTNFPSPPHTFQKKTIQKKRRQGTDYHRLESHV